MLLLNDNEYAKFFFTEFNREVRDLRDETALQLAKLFKESQEISRKIDYILRHLPSQHDRESGSREGRRKQRPKL